MLQKLTKKRQNQTLKGLFQGNIQGAWYDISDKTTLFQDIAGTIPAGVGDPCGLVKDKSGNGFNLSQSTSTARPIVTIIDGRYSLLFDGVDDFITTANITFAGSKLTYFNAFQDAGVKTRWINFWFANNVGDGFFSVAVQASSQAPLTSTLSTDVMRINNTTLSTNTRGMLYTLTSNKKFIESETNINTSVNSANGPIKLGGYTSYFNNGYFYGALVINSALSEVDISRVTTFLAKKSGISL